MRLSKYNIFSKIRNSENFFIINLLSGNADILDSLEAEKIKAIAEGKACDDQLFIQQLKENGYLADEEEEKKLYRKRYLDFLDDREKDEIQIFFVPNYSCNFGCTYCYQDQYINPSGKISDELIDAFFAYVARHFSGRRKYLTIFGGEPLLDNKYQRVTIRYIISKANEADLELCFVTNGYFLEEYIELLGKARIREIQVTLDGTETVHDSRRFLKGGGSTFEKIVKGIDSALGSGFNINLRMVVDKGNIDNLGSLAQFAINKGWTKNNNFKTQIGRNYELHHCQSSPDLLYDRIALYERISELIKDNQHITEFYKPAYSVVKFLSENGELPDPLFDSCPACKTEWAFDYTGNIYSCTATVGKAGESLGTFFPEEKHVEHLIEEWQGRDVTSINDCQACSLQLACGGGCGSVAKNRTGKICSSDCRPVRELIELGFSAYFDQKTV